MEKWSLIHKIFAAAAGSLSSGSGGRVSRKDIEEMVRIGCANDFHEVDDMDIIYRGSFDHESGDTVEVYEVKVKVLGKDKIGTVWLSFLCGENSYKTRCSYPDCLFGSEFVGVIYLDFKGTEFSDADIAAFAECIDYFDPNEQ